MNEILKSVIAQWGIVGLLALAAGYIIWDNYKANQRREKEFNDKILTENSKQQIHDTLQRVSERLTQIETTIAINKQDTDQKFQYINDKIAEAHPSIHDEHHRMDAVAKVAPAIYSLLDTSLSEIKADHLFVAIYHNGTHSVCGMPFLKFDVVCEKYKPIANPHDGELTSLYKDEDLMRHNQLPGVLFQNDIVSFDLTDPNCPLATIDQILYARALKRGTKQLFLSVFRDKSNVPHGFIGAYSFNIGMSLEDFSDLQHNIETVYNNIY